MSTALANFGFLHPRSKLVATRIHRLRADL